MKALLISALIVALLAGCSPPQPPQPSGAWVPVNHSPSAAPLSTTSKGA